MTYTLKNEHLAIEIHSLGAELKKVTHLQSNLDYLWHGGADFWKRTSPVLFPIVGAVAGGRYLHEGQTYELGQHGLARDMVFKLVSQTEAHILFELTATPESLARYPFDFKLSIAYELKETSVAVYWQVDNLNPNEMWFSIGAHPAFNVTLGEGDHIQDYELEILGEKAGLETYIFDNAKGLVTQEKVVLEAESNVLPLSKKLFETYPTLIFEDKTSVLLKTSGHGHGVQVDFEGFPYVGIWSPINEEGEIAPFVCIEPWFGLADTKPESEEIKDKQGIVRLGVNEVFKAQYTMTFK